MLTIRGHQLDLIEKDNDFFYKEQNFENLKSGGDYIKRILLRTGFTSQQATNYILLFKLLMQTNREVIINESSPDNKYKVFFKIAKLA